MNAEDRELPFWYADPVVNVDIRAEAYTYGAGRVGTGVQLTLEPQDGSTLAARLPHEHAVRLAEAILAAYRTCGVCEGQIVWDANEPWRPDRWRHVDQAASYRSAAGAHRATPAQPAETAAAGSGVQGHPEGAPEGVRVDPAGAAGVSASVHRYVSTACLHGQHDRCRRTCKFCGTACGCESCAHGPVSHGVVQPSHSVVQQSGMVADDCGWCQGHDYAPGQKLTNEGVPAGDTACSAEGCPNNPATEGRQPFRAHSCPALGGVSFYPQDPLRSTP